MTQPNSLEDMTPNVEYKPCNGVPVRIRAGCCAELKRREHPLVEGASDDFIDGRIGRAFERVEASFLRKPRYGVYVIILAYPDENYGPRLHLDACWVEGISEELFQELYQQAMERDPQV